jgi:hypothetical protein
MNRRSLNIAWLAGVVEGEGYVSSQRGSPTIRVSMTDKDVIDRIAGLWKVKVTGPYQPKGRAKQVWTAAVNGYSAIGWMMTLYRFLGDRRRAACRTSIELWNAAYGHARKVRGPDGAVLPAVCHPERPLHARQMCRQCYGQKHMAAWRARTGRNGTYYRNRREAV